MKFHFYVIKFISGRLGEEEMTSKNITERNYTERICSSVMRPWGAYTLLCDNISMLHKNNLNGLETMLHLNFKKHVLEPREILGPAVLTVDHYFHLLEGNNIVAYRGTPLDVSLSGGLSLSSLKSYVLSEKGGNIVIPRNYPGAFENQSEIKSILLEFSFDTHNGGKSLYHDLGVDEKYLTLKILDLNPSSKLSVQKHNSRGEFWYVLQGEVVAYSGEEKSSVEETVRSLDANVLYEGSSISIPVGVVHSLENISLNPAQLLEVSFGRYDENDIMRYADKYGRVK